MKWALHTAAATSAADLADHLTEQMEQYCATAPDAAGRAAVPMWEPTQDDQRIYMSAGIQKRQAEAEAMRKKVAADFSAQLPRLTKQMESAIEAASAMAKTMGNASSNFQASLYGHFDPDFADGIEERVSVNVDIA